MWAYNLQIPPVNGKQKFAALTNEKQDTFDQLHTDSTVKRSKVGPKNKKKIKISRKRSIC